MVYHRIWQHGIGCLRTSSASRYWSIPRELPLQLRSNIYLPGEWHRAIIWTNAGLSSIGPLETNVSEVLIKNSSFLTDENAFENVVCEIAAILSKGDELNKPRNQFG